MRMSAFFPLTIACFTTFGAAPALATTVVCGQVITQSTHVIDGDGVNAAADDGIDNTGGFDNVRIVHGTIQQFTQGVRLVGTTKNKVEHVTVL